MQLQQPKHLPQIKISYSLQPDAPSGCKELKEHNWKKMRRCHISEYYISIDIKLGILLD